jgi:hypothetical protein
MNNPADMFSQAERRRIIASERRLSTYRAFAEADADVDLGGRFSKLHPTSVTGALPNHQFPQQPETSPANQMAMMPDEPPLGYSVNDLDPTGERWEQERSKRDAPASPEAVDAGASGGSPDNGTASVRPATKAFRRRF